ncbi:MAG: 50S ribosomal protein L11 methyltransferase, partial [Myxococcota bacterium]
MGVVHANFQVLLVAPDAALAERAVAEAWAAGAAGILEEEVAGGVQLTVYFPQDSTRDVIEALQGLEREGLRLEEAEVIDERDWAEAWKDGLSAIQISPALLIRPRWVSAPLRPGQAEVVIDPGQAFGTGRHESTLLALQSLDELAGTAAEMNRVLDVGTGSGILALAALRRGAGHAVGFDIDRRAVEEAVLNAAANDLEERVKFFAGPIEALTRETFELVMVNLLRTEMWPIAGEIAARVE